MKQIRLWLTVFLTLELIGCTTRSIVRMPVTAALLKQQQREKILTDADHWILRGRLGVSDSHHGGSGSLVWHQKRDQTDIMLRGPLLSGMSFHLHIGPDGTWLKGLKKAPLYDTDAQSLLRQTLGLVIPLRYLRAWVLGVRADPGAAVMHFGPHGLPVLLQQDGWHVRYLAWDTHRSIPLPSRIFADKPPYRLRLMVESWTLPAGGNATQPGRS